MFTLAAGVVLLVAAPVVWAVTRSEPAGQNVSSVGGEAAAALANAGAVPTSQQPASVTADAPEVPSFDGAIPEPKTTESPSGETPPDVPTTGGTDPE